jgi:endonuclease III
MKKDFDLNTMLQRIQKATSAYPKAAMFELFDRGYTSVFEQLIACMISIRTLDEVSIPVAERLFARARTPKQMLRLTPAELEKLLHGSSFPGQKAYNMLEIAQTALEKYNGNLPGDFKQLTDLRGVGPKCANLALGIASGTPAISVDIHVHRVVNRWGYISASTPEKTLLALEKKVPRDKWIDINRLLMPFGKHICTGNLPHCSICPVLDYCRQIGVTKHR